MRNSRNLTLFANRVNFPSALAKRVRVILGKSVEDQKSCKTQADALGMWRQAVESLGVLVFQTGFFGGHYPVDIKKDMRGVALHFDRLPIIIMNSKRFGDRPNFYDHA